MKKSFIIWFILAFLFASVPLIAKAETYTAPKRWSFQLSTVYVGDTALAACQSGAALYGYSNVSVINSTATSGDCRNNATSSVFGSVQYVSYCPAGHTQSGNTCTAPTSCPSGQIRMPNGSCAVDCTQNPNDKQGQPVFYNGSVDSTLCDGSCTYAQGSSLTMCTGDGRCMGAYGTKTGANCSTSNITSGNTTEFDCIKQGKSYGTVNGVVVCVNPGTAGSAPVTTKPPTTTSSTSSGGNTTSTTSNSTHVVNNNGTVTTTTTITTITNGGTPVVTTETETKPKETFCQENPNLSICKESNVTGGADCSNPPAATGDAVQTAILKQAWEARCRVEKEASTHDYAQGGIDALNGVPDPIKSPFEASERTTLDLSTMSLFDGSDITGTSGATCPTPRSFTIPIFGTFTLAFTYFCYLAQIVGMLMLMGTSVWSIKTVTGAL